jgi:predicted alpha/beta superfamily hydrolase
MSPATSVLGCLAVFAASSVVAAQATGSPDVQDIVIGQRIEIYSAVLNETRPLEIYLPAGYEESEQRYPVLVALDGDWFFRYCTSIVDMMSPNHFPEMIVVGLLNTDRNRDLDPVNPDHPDPLGGTVAFRRFVAQELLPYLDQTYRTQPYRVLSGHSLAGYFTVYSLFAEPGLFDAYIATSPSLGSEERRAVVHTEADAVRASLTNGRMLYFSSGGEEPWQMQTGIDDLATLCERRADLGVECSWEVFAGEGHVPVKGFYQGLRWVFADWFPTMDVFMTGDLPALRRHYAELSEQFGFDVQPTPDILYGMGNRQVRESNPDNALALFEYMISVYPESGPAHSRLAVLYSLNGDTERAEWHRKEATRLGSGG